MVARVNTGKSIRGVLNYNENKVKEGLAHCIDAVGFGSTAEELSIKQKLKRFTHLIEKNKIAKTNAIHISLNFSPGENISDKTLNEIANTYMEKIGFGEQPYLVYRHTDAAHPHIHIATVNIRSNGKRIDTHDIGRNQSAIARKEIENEFGLIKAEAHEQQSSPALKPADLKAAHYGTSPTKNAISNIVRTVAKHYYYTNFKQFSDILLHFNIYANRGEPGTRLFEKGGLTYQLFDHKKNKPVGVPIKSSSIYEKPTLKNIESRHEINRNKRKPYRDRLTLTIEKVLENAYDKKTFIAALAQENIHASFKQNADGWIYGLTFFDKSTCCYFDGSEIGKGYSAKNILDRLQTGSDTENTFNREFVRNIMSSTDFERPFVQNLSSWLDKKLLVRPIISHEGNLVYRLGIASTNPASFCVPPKKISAWLYANGVRPSHQESLQQAISMTEKEILGMLEDLFKVNDEYNHLPYHLLKEARKKNKRKSN